MNNKEHKKYKIIAYLIAITVLVEIIAINNSVLILSRQDCCSEVELERSAVMFFGLADALIQGDF